MKPFYLLILKEINELFFSKATLLFLVILSFITGYSFFSAVVLFSNASVAAINNSLYATGFEPVLGVFVPAFGGLFILFSLFLPFIIIPLIVVEKEQNTLVLLLQIPFTINKILCSKIIAALLFLILVFLLMMPATFIWKMCGGHIAWLELLLLVFGYFLYGVFVISVSIFSGSVFKNTAGASIFSIFLITFSWVIDFGKDMNLSPAILAMSNFTTSQMLRSFEQGIFSLTSTFYFLIISLVLIILTRCFFDVVFKVRWLVLAVFILIVAIFIGPFFGLNIDVTESHRHSFPANITEPLKKVPEIEIEVYLRRTDSRFKDYEENFLKRLQLIKKNMKLKIVKEELLDDKYGLFVYKVKGKKAETYSNSEEEIFPIIFELSGITENKTEDKNKFSGYPLVLKKTQTTIISYIYYLAIPAILLLLFITKNFFNKRRFNI